MIFPLKRMRSNRALGRPASRNVELRADVRRMGRAVNSESDMSRVRDSYETVAIIGEDLRIEDRVLQFNTSSVTQT